MKQKNIIFLSILLIASALRFFYAINIELHPDEAYYWMWSRFPDFSYYDQGPGVAYYIIVFTSILGNTIAALKLAAITSSFFVYLLIYAIARELKLGQNLSLIAVAAAFFVPGFFGGSLVIMHDSPLILFWTASLYISIRYIHTENILWLYGLAVCLALGGLSKYTMFFFVISLFLWFLITPEFHSILKNIHLYLSLIVTSIIISPVFIWNHRNNWDGFDAIIHLRSSGGAFSSGSKTFQYFAGQLISLSPVWFIVLSGIILTVTAFFFIKLYTSFKKNASAENMLNRLPLAVLRGSFFSDPAFRLVAINAVILPLFFLFLSRNKITQANWVYPSYPALLILMIFAIEKSEKKYYRNLFYTGFAFALLLDVFSVFSLQFSSAFTGLSGKKISSSYLPAYKTAGFKNIISGIDDLRKKLDPEAPIAANRYQDAAISTFYLDGQPFVPSLNVMQKNQYSYWPNIEKGKNYFVFSIDEKPCQKLPNLMLPLMKLMFREVIEFPEFNIASEGRIIKKYRVWYGHDFIQQWDEPLINYLMNVAILDIMPGLTGRDPRGKRGKSQKHAAQKIPAENTDPGDTSAHFSAIKKKAYEMFPELAERHEPAAEDSGNIMEKLQNFQTEGDECSFYEE